ncbi:MAG: bifunctional hydroxymethylpyrimidine kinase/phosphomethylpyrimidine kinase [Clostridia bacterium]|nr:bifunctional hydroxymethylpyrimidine kinase/phosphomethylpyrimidine kinase [Clostridia bacterium]
MAKICFIGLAGNSVFLYADHFHREGETVSAHSFYNEPGGKGYNQAVAAARLGGACSFIGAFGKDDGAGLCVKYLQNEGIKPLPVYKDIPSAYACILTDSKGENRVTVYGGASALLNGEDIKSLEREIVSSDMLVLQNEVSIDANIAAVEIAEKNGIPVLINPAPAVGMETELLKRAYVITPNLHEAETLFGSDWEKGMKNAGIKRAVVTLGSKGAAVYEDGDITTIPPINTKVVDTTGAGDCFTAALAVMLCDGETLKNAAVFANKAASIAVSRPYAVAAMPKRKEI